jgi:carboxylesterase type B
MDSSLPKVDDCQTFTYKTVGDLKIDLDVWLPENVKSDRSIGVQDTPAVVWIHGGGGFSGDKSHKKSPRWFPFWMKGGTFALISLNSRA